MTLSISIRQRLIRNLQNHARKRKNAGFLDEYTPQYLQSLPDPEFCFMLTFLEEFYNGRSILGKFIHMQAKESYNLNNKRNRDIFCHIFFERLDDVERQETQKFEHTSWGHNSNNNQRCEDE